MAEINENIIFITKANQNFSEVARKCKELGKVYILKNNKIAFSLECIDFEDDKKMKINDYEELLKEILLHKTSTIHHYQE